MRAACRRGAVERRPDSTRVAARARSDRDPATAALRPDRRWAVLGSHLHSGPMVCGLCPDRVLPALGLHLCRYRITTRVRSECGLEAFYMHAGRHTATLGLHSDGGRVAAEARPDRTRGVSGVRSNRIWTAVSMHPRCARAMVRPHPEHTRYTGGLRPDRNRSASDTLSECGQKAVGVRSECNRSTTRNLTPALLRASMPDGRPRRCRLIASLAPERTGPRVGGAGHRRRRSEGCRGTDRFRTRSDECPLLGGRGGGSVWGPVRAAAPPLPAAPWSSISGPDGRAARPRRLSRPHLRGSATEGGWPGPSASCRSRHRR